MRINSGLPKAYSPTRNITTKSDATEKSDKQDKISSAEVPLKDSVRIRPAIKLDESELANMASETKEPEYAKKLLASTQNDILSNAQAVISAQANLNPDSIAKLLK